MGKVVLINISISAKQLIQMNDADWQLGMSTICWWLQLSGEENKRRQHPAFFPKLTFNHKRLKVETKAKNGIPVNI